MSKHSIQNDPDIQQWIENSRIEYLMKSKTINFAKFMNIDNKYIVDGLTIDRKQDGGYMVFTISTQHFSINSLDELTNERFEKEIERQKQYEKNSSDLMGRKL